MKVLMLIFLLATSAQAKVHHRRYLDVQEAKTAAQKAVWVKEAKEYKENENLIDKMFDEAMGAVEAAISQTDYGAPAHEAQLFYDGKKWELVGKYVARRIRAYGYKLEVVPRFGQFEDAISVLVKW